MNWSRDIPPSEAENPDINDFILWFKESPFRAIACLSIGGALGIVADLFLFWRLR